MTELPYSLREDNDMIAVISKTPAIYNKLHEDYKNYSLKEEEWIVIADKIGRPIASCKKRWRTIRDNYYKQKKVSKYTGRPCGRKYPLANKLLFLDYKKEKPVNIKTEVKDTNEGSDNFEDFDDVSSNFLEIVTENEDQSDNAEFKLIEPSNNSVSSLKIVGSDETFDPLANLSGNKTNSLLCQVTNLLQNKNNKLDTVVKKINELTDSKTGDDVDLFFKSMAMTVKNFSPENIARVKLKVCQVVVEMELQKD